jgi:hypothetical protein
VTITVVNPQKQIPSQKIVPQQKFPEVSILPTVATTSQSFSISKQGNSAKKKSTELTNVNVKDMNKIKLLSLAVPTPSITENIKKTANIEKIKMSEKTENGSSSQITISDNNNMNHLTKKDRKKLRRELEKQETLKKELENKQCASTLENQSQIVTIKRIMESNNAEPTVTITLKGQTPAEDRVLFTLVNGQTKDSLGVKQSQVSGKKKKNKGNNLCNQQQQPQTDNKSQVHNNNNNSNNSNNNGNNHGNSNGNTNTNTNTNSNTNSNSNIKYEQSQKYDIKCSKQHANKDKFKAGKHQEDSKSRQQQNIGASETKITQSKKDKKKNNENKENIMKTITNENSHRQENNALNKKSSKVNYI